MPQADLHYSADLEIDAARLLAEVEAVISGHDSGAGDCKGRAHAVEVFHHSHVLLRVAILRKPHRDAAFCEALVAKLVAVVDGHLPKGTERAVELSFLAETYVTGQV